MNSLVAVGHEIFRKLLPLEDMEAGSKDHNNQKDSKAHKMKDSLIHKKEGSKDHKKEVGSMESKQVDSMDRTFSGSKKLLSVSLPALTSFLKLTFKIFLICFFTENLGAFFSWFCRFDVRN